MLHQTALAQGQKEACVLGPEAAKPIMETHTLSPYPRDSITNDEAGAVTVEVLIGVNGLPTQVNLKTSSGFPRLDEQTRKWLLDHWRWQPPGRNCSAIAIVKYAWSLDDAGPSGPPIPSSPPSPPYDGEGITRLLLEHR